MAKDGRILKAEIPTYQKDRTSWRRLILATIMRASNETDLRFSPGDSLEVVVLLYLKKGKRHRIHDVDNRLKDILDAMQGRLGGRTTRARERLIENDNQVCRVLIEKQPIPKAMRDDAGGKILIRPYRPRRWPLQGGKGKRLFK